MAISLDPRVLKRLDRLVGSVFESRSEAIQTAIEEKLSRMHQTDLARECSKLDKHFEQALADEGLSDEIDEWPEY